MSFLANLTKEMSIFYNSIYELSYFVFPVFNFGPILNKGSLISSLTRKAFAIETSNNLKSAFLLLEEIFKDEEYFC